MNIVTNFFQRLKHFQPLLFPLLSGILVGTSYPPFASWAVTFCWVPLWFSLIEERKPKGVFKKAWITQFTLSLIGFHWIAQTAHDFGFLPWFLSIAALLIFCATMHLHIPLSLALAKWIQNKIRSLTSIPTFFFICALIQGLVERIWPMIFPWHLGYGVLYSRLEVAQLAEFIGFQGLSQIFFLLNAVFATGIWLLKDHKVKGSVTIATGIFLFFGMNILGSIVHPQTNAQRSITALIIQANIGQFDKIAGDLANKSSNSAETNENKLQETVLKKYIDLTNEALTVYPSTEVIIWPETALPDYYDIEFLSRPRQVKLREQIMNWKRALITGAYSRDAATKDVYNALFIFNDGGDLAAPAYRKSELLAFGEYLPGGETFPFLYKLMPFVSSFGRGLGPEVKGFHVGDKQFKAAPQICYESLYDSFSRRAANLGPDFHVNITNDSWFGTTFEPFQHGTMNWARAIETRRPLIRATNTGQSSVILHDGQVVLKSPLQQEWFGAVKIPLPDQEVTFFMKYGYLDWIVYLVILLILICKISLRTSDLENLRSKGRHV